MKKYSEFFAMFIIFIGIWILNGKYLFFSPPKNMANIASALASVFGSLVGFSIAALGIVFAIVQKEAYNALFQHDHAEIFFRAFKNNQIISFLGFIISAVAMLDDFSKNFYVCNLIISVLVGWAWSFCKLVSFFNGLVDAEIKIRKKQSSKPISDNK